MHIERSLKKIVLSKLQPGKVCLIFGARRTGKTYLLQEIQKECKGKTLFYNAEDADVQRILGERSAARYKNFFEGIDLLIIDEAQVIPDIGKILKFIVDEIKGLKVIATGSSGFDLLNRTGEPLTGRSISLQLFPIAQKELSSYENMLQTKQNLEDRLVFGSYPEVIISKNTSVKKEYLLNLTSAYLLKDILVLDGVRNSSKMYDILRMLAYQTGNEVSYNEISNKLGLSKNTIEKYLDLLSKVFVIFKLGGFSKNIRKEISKNSKWYFSDNGVRNALISDFRPLAIRNDVGTLWENYLISERLKRNACKQEFAKYYFWRTYDQQEIDLIEENNGKISSFEFKWSDRKVSVPAAFKTGYPDAKFKVISRENYLNWVC